MTVVLTGYAHPEYAASLSEFGAPCELPSCHGFILERQVPGTDERDAMGCYPLFDCSDWARLGDDVAALDGRLVSLFVAPTPFCPLSPDELRRTFPDLARPHKQHRVVDFEQALEVSRHHRKCARQALRKVSVEVWPDGVPPGFGEQWLGLHGHLVARHAISGIRAFSERAFERQLRVPGLVVVRAERAGVAVGAQLWFVAGDVAYGHVLAISPEGYRLGAAYAMYQSALEHFAGRVRFCDLGATPGAVAGAASSLDWFKRGWSNATRTAFICGRVLDRSRYDALVARQGRQDFFPEYRAGP